MPGIHRPHRTLTYIRHFSALSLQNESIGSIAYSTLGENNTDPWKTASAYHFHNQISLNKDVANAVHVFSDHGCILKPLEHSLSWFIERMLSVASSRPNDFIAEMSSFHCGLRRFWVVNARAVFAHLKEIKGFQLTSISPTLGSALVLWLPFSLRSLHAGHEICVSIQILHLQYKILCWGRGLFLSGTPVAHLPLFTILSSRLPTSPDFSSDVHDEKSFISFQVTSQVARHYPWCDYQTFVSTPMIPNNSTFCFSSLTLEQEAGCS